MNKVAAALTALRVLRLLRVMLLAKNASMKILMLTIWNSLSPVFYMTLLMMLYVYVCLPTHISISQGCVRAIRVM